MCSFHCRKNDKFITGISKNALGNEPVCYCYNSGTPISGKVGEDFCNEPCNKYDIGPGVKENDLCGQVNYINVFDHYHQESIAVTKFEALASKPGTPTIVGTEIIETSPGKMRLKLVAPSFLGGATDVKLLTYKAEISRMKLDTSQIETFNDRVTNNDYEVFNGTCTNNPRDKSGYIIHEILGPWSYCGRLCTHLEYRQKTLEECKYKGVSGGANFEWMGEVSNSSMPKGCVLTSKMKHNIEFYSFYFNKLHKQR